MEIKWTVGGGGDSAPSSQGGKIPYVAPQRVTDKTTDSQKEGIRIWNLMVKTLRDNNLMEEK
jgi:hypothetical protein